jgi:hypothetical protein
VDRDTKRRLSDLVLRRICFVCGESVSERSPNAWRLSDAPGVYHAWYRILTHQGDCAEIVRQESRIYDRSARGRWRPPAQVRVRLRLIREARHRQEPQP